MSGSSAVEVAESTPSLAQVADADNEAEDGQTLQEPDISLESILFCVYVCCLFSFSAN